ncbi:MAG: ABC transporter ATP-binding protein [Gammaproteobacteria bacterium]
MPHVEISALRVHLGDQDILHGLDLAIPQGEFVVLLGPSGCGKSTLLHSIAGLTEVTSGRIAIGGRDMTDVDPSERGIGMVFQSYALYPTMTVEKNMSFGLSIAGTPKAEIARRVARVAGMLQLEPLLKRKPAELSGGQRQRVAIGRALVRQAQVYLFDEPLSNLDAQLRAELRRELKLLHQQLGSTMVYVTHDQVEAMTLASRIVVMRAGRIQQIGPPAEVYERPANLFVAGFLGAPAMNFIDGALQDGRFACPAFSLIVPCRAMGAAVLGVRPEHLAVHARGAFEAQVALIEPMGNHQVLWLALGSLRLAAIVNDNRVFQAGQSVRFDIDAQRVTLFDKGTEMRL